MQECTIICRTEPHPLIYIYESKSGKMLSRLIPTKQNIKLVWPNLHDAAVLVITWTGTFLDHKVFLQLCNTLECMYADWLEVIQLCQCNVMPPRIITIKFKIRQMFYTWLSCQKCCVLLHWNHNSEYQQNFIIIVSLSHNAIFPFYSPRGIPHIPLYNCLHVHW